MKPAQTLKDKTLSATITTPSGQVLPMFLRMPPPGRCCSVTQLRRGCLYELARAGKIKTATIKRKSALRGIKLILTSSLLEYCNQCLDTPEDLEQEELIEE
jgi:hypothetical protein